MFSVSDGSLRPARAGAEVSGDRYRFTVLTSRLIRMEHSAIGMMLDHATSVVVNRDFEVPEFTVTRDGDALTIRTEHLELHYDGREFSPSGLSVDLFGAPDIHYSTWRYGEQLPQLLPLRGNLAGTARTLDDVDGECALEPGILSTYGFATLDDSTSPVFTEDGWVGGRPASGQDLYLFAHGRDYQGALNDYFHLTGAPALVPRYVLGNWWSRYWRYDHNSFLAVMDQFSRDRIPFSVSVVDMDWHIVDVDPALGTGWTGYTWNRELFPDPPAFLAELHRRGLAVTLNVHPADGVRRHEDAYDEVATAVGVDPATGDAIPFDISSRTFVDAYLDHVHHPLEDEGVDFWWLDWQSGGVSRIPGLDPLWMLNHVHFTDSGRGDRRPLTFSRYSGPGSHRYPIGFSGDSIATWDSLNFQPYFTSTAANIGYFWWSHDIGGHMHGKTDPELIARWVQFGALSPVNRLHSSASPFGSKEPHLLGSEAGDVAARFLRLRHVLVPYLYTAAWFAHAEGVALSRPLYHLYPRTHEAYEHRNSYMLGEDLFVAPITTPLDDEARVGSVTAWIPEGRWTDLFTGTEYLGGRTTTLHRPLRDYPVLARAGSVIPLAADAMAEVAENPRHLVLRVYPGDGESTLMEDDGAAAPQPWRTTVTQTCARRADGLMDLRITVSTSGSMVARPLESLAFDLAGVSGVDEATLAINGQRRRIGLAEGDDDPSALLAAALRLVIDDVDLHGDIVLDVRGARAVSRDVSSAVFDVLQRAHVEVTLKDRAFAAVNRASGVKLADELASIGLPPRLLAAVLEILAANGFHPSA